MNFQTVRQVKGQKDAKNFPVKVDMFGTFTEIGGTAFNINQKPYSDCQITDDTTEKHKVRLYGDAPPTNLLGMRCSFSLSAYDGNYQGKQYTGYSGFWNDRVPQQPQNSPQGSPQAPQTATQPPNKAQGIDSVLIRSSALGMAVRLYAAGKIEYKAMFLEAGYYAEYIETGQSPMGEAAASPTADSSQMSGAEEVPWN